MCNSRLCSLVACQFAILASVFATDDTGIGSWSQVGTGWPDDSDGIEAIHLIHLPTNQLLVWDVTNWEDHEHTTYKIFSLDTFTLSNSYTVSLGNMFCAGATHLYDGSVFVAGGHWSKWIDIKYRDGQGGDDQPEAEWNKADGMMDTNIFNGVSSPWTAEVMMHWARWYPTCTELPDSNVLVNGGSYLTPVYDGDRKIKKYDTHFTDIPELYDRAGQSGSQSGFMGGSACMYEPGKIFKSGFPKDHPTGSETNQAAYIDCTAGTPQWTSLTAMNSNRSMHNCTLLPDGSILITGGCTRGDPNNILESNAVLGAEMHRPGTTWTHLTMASMQTPRLYHSTAMLLPDARVLVAVGEENGGSKIARKNAEIFEPPYLHTGVSRPTIGTGTPSSVLVNHTIKIYTPDTNSIEKIAWVKLGAVTHAFDQDQRYVPGPDKSEWTIGFDVTGPYIQISAPGNNRVAPPGWYMLFIMKKTTVANWNNRVEYVPSVAKYVRIISPIEGG